MEAHMLLLCTSTIFIFFLISLPNSYSQDHDCERPYNCGTIQMPYGTYPFWSEDRFRYCGSTDGLKLNCRQNDSPSFEAGSQIFNVTQINQHSHILTVVRTDLAYDNCSSDLTNISLSHINYQFNLSILGPVKNVTLFYDCPSYYPISGFNNFTCKAPSTNNNLVNYYGFENEEQFAVLQSQCGRRIQVPISGVIDMVAEDGIDALNQYLNQGFDVKYMSVDESRCSNCAETRGICGSGITNTSQFTCYCQDGSHNSDCHRRHNKLSVKNKVIVGVSVLAFTVIVMMIIGFALYKRRIKTKTSYAKSYITQSSSYTTSYDSSVVEIDGHGSKYLGAHVFTYSELEEATNHFDATKELGDGGFGTVYYGKLRDGRCVAVKRLYENNYKRVEQFQNEVAILTRLRHQNLVALYGCTSRHSRELLLVYEYISNGTVADHLHGPRATTTLPWNTRLNIAIETASALAYLHASDIIHRDVKTNNILLDDHFCVKVADFGLSRLFPNDVTHISTAPQGTPGYVDPEYHECYQLTDKSDVYSFGVVLVELISSLPAVDITRHRHEINLATMAVNKIHSRKLHEMVDPALGFERDGEVRKRISAVAELAFQCLQSVKDMRPYMREVVDVLRDIESDGKSKRKEEVMDICEDDVVLLKSDDFSPPSPEPHDSNVASMSTTPSNSTN